MHIVHHVVGVLVAGLSQGMLLTLQILIVPSSKIDKIVNTTDFLVQLVLLMMYGGLGLAFIADDRAFSFFIMI
jgi:hypothetical protein